MKSANATLHHTIRNCANSTQNMRSLFKYHTKIQTGHILTLVLGLLVSAALAWAIGHTLLIVPLYVRKRIRFDAPNAVKCGDLVLFSSTLKLPCDVQKFFTGSQYTHVGIVFVDAKGVPFVWEVRREEGSVLIRLDRQFDDETYRCIVRSINKTVNPKVLERIIRAARGQPYTHSFWRGILSRWSIFHDAIPPPINENKVLASARCCSEMVAETYSKLGVLDFSKWKNGTSQVLPGDFSERGFNVPLADGYAFGSEYLLIGPRSMKRHVRSKLKNNRNSSI